MGDASGRMSSTATARSNRRDKAVAAGFVVLMAWPMSVLAQTSPSIGEPTAAPAAPQQAATASVGHAAVKGLTLKAINALAAMTVFTTGTGSVVAGGTMSIAVAATSYTVFVTNDYIWDRFFPNTNIAANQSFSMFSSIGRNTAKFLTFKPAVMAADWTVIYLFTGSFASTLAMGSAYSLLSPITFYANNMAWDWYDWWSVGPVSK